MAIAYIVGGCEHLPKGSFKLPRQGDDDPDRPLRRVALAGGGDRVSGRFCILRLRAIGAITVPLSWSEAPDIPLRRALDRCAHRARRAAGVAALPGNMLARAFRRCLTAHGRRRRHARSRTRTPRWSRPEPTPGARPAADRAPSNPGRSRRRAGGRRDHCPVADRARARGQVDLFHQPSPSLSGARRASVSWGARCRYPGPSIPRDDGSRAAAAPLRCETSAPLHAHGVTAVSIRLSSSIGQAGDLAGPIAEWGAAADDREVEACPLDVLIVGPAAARSYVATALCRLFLNRAVVDVHPAGRGAAWMRAGPGHCFRNVSDPGFWAGREHVRYISAPELRAVGASLRPLRLSGEAVAPGSAFPGRPSGRPGDPVGRRRKGRRVARGDGSGGEAYRVLARRFIDDGLG